MALPISRNWIVARDLPIALEEGGSGRHVLFLHGGGGPGTLTGLAEPLAWTKHVLLPTHPGWNGTPRPAWLSGVDDLAMTYLQVLENHDLRDVLVIGASFGGWVGAEMAVRDTAWRIGGLVLIDAVGIQVEGEPIRDVFDPDSRALAADSFHDPDRFFVDPEKLPAAAQAQAQANQATLRALAGQPYLHDPKLLHRLGRVRIPTLVIWGESDRIVTPAYGAAYAGALANATFALVKEAGHLPHLEQPEATVALIEGFLNQMESPAEKGGPLH